MAARGVIMSGEAVRYRCRKFGKPTPISCATGIPEQATSGTWTRRSSPSPANTTISGGRRIRMGMSSAFSYNVGVTKGGQAILPEAPQNMVVLCRDYPWEATSL